MTRLLIDNSLSPRLAESLRHAGHDAVHIRDVARPDSSDDVVFDLGERQDRTIVAQDTDFGTILAMRSVSKPSVVLIRRREKSTESLLPLLISCLEEQQADLSAGAIIVVEDERLRIRRLPIQK